MEMTIAQAITMLTKLDTAIENALAIEVADEAVKEMQHAIRNNVYEAYTPRFYSRRMEHGGLLDPHNIITHVENGNTLVVDNVTGLQNLWYSDTWAGDTSLLTPIIEEGNEAYIQPFPRPFLDYTVELLMGNGLAEQALKRGLARQGINTEIGVTFTA